MAKYAKYQRPLKPKKLMNPLWRGIGCILIVVVPLLAFGLTVLFVQPIIATGLVPNQLLGYVHFPEWVFRYPMLSDTSTFISSLKDLWLNLIIFFVMVLILTSVSSLLYTVVYSIVGPSPYTDVDAPPSKYKPKKYTR
jgi:hypothetical protein